MALVFNIPSASYGPGTFTIPSRPIPDGLQGRAVIDLDMTQFTNTGSTLQVSFEISLDGGNTWVFWWSAGRRGGVFSDALGNTYTRMTSESPLLPAGTGRRVRGTIEITGSALTTSGTLSAA